jgi:hypothetical protein
VFACKERRIHVKFKNKFVKEDLVHVELFAEGKEDKASNTCPDWSPKAHCRSNTSVNVNGCVK